MFSWWSQTPQISLVTSLPVSSMAVNGYRHASWARHIMELYSTEELSTTGKSCINGRQSDVRFETRTTATATLYLIYSSIMISVYVIKTLNNGLGSWDARMTGPELHHVISRACAIL